MATRSKSAAKSGTKKKATKPAATNGAKKNTGTTRVKDKLEGLTEARRRNIAKLIFKERSKSPSTSWPDISAMIEEKYDWTLPGSMTGRRLLREYGPENAEEAIIQQNREAAATKTKKKSTKKGKAKAAPVVDEDEDEEELEDEDLEDEDEDEEDVTDEVDEDDEDEEDEDEEDEEEEPPAKAKKVRVTKGRGKKANPSK